MTSLSLLAGRTVIGISCETDIDNSPILLGSGKFVVGYTCIEYDLLFQMPMTMT